MGLRDDIQKPGISGEASAEKGSTLVDETVASAKESARSTPPAFLSPRFVRLGFLLTALWLSWFFRYSVTAVPSQSLDGDYAVTDRWTGEVTTCTIAGGVGHHHCSE